MKRRRSKSSGSHPSEEVTKSDHSKKQTTPSSKSDKVSDIPMEESSSPVTKSSSTRATTEWAARQTPTYFQEGVSGTVDPSTQSIRTSDDGIVTGVSTYRERSSNETSNMAALSLTLPLAMTILVVILLATFIFLGRKFFICRGAKRRSVKSNNSKVIKEVVEVKDKLKHKSLSQTFVVPSMNCYSDLNGDQTSGDTASKSNTVEEVQYAEVDENLDLKDSIPQIGNAFQLLYNTLEPQGKHGYEEAVLRVPQRNDEYAETKSQGKRSDQGHEEGTHGGNQNNQGYETSKATSPIYHTLHPDTPDASYTSVPGKKQNGEYDALNRLKNSSRGKSLENSDYDTTQRIGKAEVIFESSNQIGSEYAVAGSRSANSSDYDMLDLRKEAVTKTMV